MITFNIDTNWDFYIIFMKAHRIYTKALKNVNRMLFSKSKSNVLVKGEKKSERFIKTYIKALFIKIKYQKLYVQQYLYNKI